MSMITPLRYSWIFVYRTKCPSLGNKRPLHCFSFECTSLNSKRPPPIPSHQSSWGMCPAPSTSVNLMTSALEAATSAATCI